MYKRILVTLDGSKLSEMALPHAGAIAKGLGAEVVLLSVVAPLPSRELLEHQDAAWDANLPIGGATTPLPPDWFGRHTLPVRSRHTPEQKKEWETYIAGLQKNVESQVAQYMMDAAGDLTASGVKIQPVVLFGNPAEQIIEYAKANGVDLIVMSTHGQTGVGRWFAGSVAQKVLQGANVPVLLVRVNQ